MARFNIWIANQANGSVTVYAAGRYGNVKPIRAITGSAMAQPIDVKLDRRGSIYVLNAANNSIAVYAPNAHGPSLPRAVIGGPHAGLAGVTELALAEGG